MTISYQRLPRRSLVDDAFYASLTGTRQTKKTYRNRGTYTMKNAVYEPTYMKQTLPRDQEVCDASHAPNATVFDDRILETWGALGGYFSDDRAVNDRLFYKHDCRRSIAGLLYTPSDAWEVFAQREIGLSPMEFLATGATLDRLESTLDSYKALNDGDRVTLHFLLTEALNESVDAAVADLCARLEDTTDPATPVTAHASTVNLGGFAYIGGQFTWRGR